MTSPVAIFGSALRTKVLVAIAKLGETYPSELAAMLDSRLLPVQRVLVSLESTGMIATRLRGRVRLVTLNPRWFARRELFALLLRLGETPMFEQIGVVRRRPRAADKIPV